MGWFDGNPVHLDPVPRRRYAGEVLGLIGNVETVKARVRELYDAGDYQMGLELCELLENGGHPVKELKKEGLPIQREMVSGQNRYGEVTSFARYRIRADGETQQ